MGILTWVLALVAPASAADTLPEPPAAGSHCKMPLAEIELAGTARIPAGRPAIDRLAPSETQVATFALG